MPDEHAHTAVEADDSDPKSVPTLLVGAVGMILLMVIVLLVEVLYHRTTEAEIYRKVISEQPLELRQVQAEQREQLNSYRWVSQSEGIAAIPIDRAMDLIVDEAQEGKQP
jgi:heme exporter protein D